MVCVARVHSYTLFPLLKPYIVWIYKCVVEGCLIIVRISTYVLAYMGVQGMGQEYDYSIRCDYSVIDEGMDEVYDMCGNKYIRGWNLAMGI